MHIFEKAAKRAGLLAIFILAASTGAKAREETEMTIWQASDLHYLAPELTDGGDFFQDFIENSDGKAMYCIEEITDALLENVIREKPDALILSGDLSYNGEKASHQALAKKLKKVEEADIPVYVIPGNHDLDNSSAVSFSEDGYTYTETVDSGEFEQIYSEFGYSEALSRDEASLSYLAQLSPALQLLMLDVNAVETMGTVPDSTLAWAEQCLKDAQDADMKVVAVSHQNVLEHNALFSYGYQITNSDRLLFLYEKYGVLCNLSGHMHIQHISKSENGFREFLTTALCVWPNQAGVLSLDGSRLCYETKSVTQDREDLIRGTYIFAWVTAYRQAIAQLETDTEPPAFSDMEEKLMEALKSAKEPLSGLEALSETEKLTENEELAGFQADVNTAYFAGKTNLLGWRDDLCERWEEISPLYGYYLRTVKEEGLRDFTSYTGPENINEKD